MRARHFHSSSSLPRFYAPLASQNISHRFLLLVPHFVVGCRCCAAASQSAFPKPPGGLYSLPYLPERPPAAEDDAQAALTRAEWWELLFFVKKLEAGAQREMIRLLMHNLGQQVRMRAHAWEPRLLMSGLPQFSVHFLCMCKMYLFVMKFLATA